MSGTVSSQPASSEVIQHLNAIRDVVADLERIGMRIAGLYPKDASPNAKEQPRPSRGFVGDVSDTLWEIRTRLNGLVDHLGRAFPPDVEKDDPSETFATQPARYPR